MQRPMGDAQLATAPVRELVVAVAVRAAIVAQVELGQSGRVPGWKP